MESPNFKHNIEHTTKQSTQAQQLYGSIIGLCDIIIPAYGLYGLVLFATFATE